MQPLPRVWSRVFIWPPKRGSIPSPKLRFVLTSVYPRFSPPLQPTSHNPSGYNPTMPGLAITSATIFPTPTDPPIHNATILIDSGKILAVTSTPPAPGTPTLDCSACSITAGFWNSHVHFFERKWSDAASIPAAELTHQLEDMITRFGFTTVFDLSSPWANTRIIHDRIASAEVAGPRILSTGEGMLPKDPGLPGDAVMNILGVMKPPPLEIADPAEARAAIRRLL